MPLYEYQCEQCGVRFEVIQKFSDASVETCKACGGTVQRLPSAPAIQFKGTGWYITDYAKKGNGKETPSSAPASTTASSSSTAEGGAKAAAGSSDAGGSKGSASNSPASGSSQK